MIKQNWTDAAQRCQQTGEAYALVTILGCSGSTPRDQSSKMVVTVEDTFDTIGGGNLEFVVTNKAHELLAKNQDSQEIIPFPLAGALGQCCGGNATVLIETFTACRFQLALFGAGHVAKELVKILGSLPCKVNWIDSRQELFPSSTPSNVTAKCHEDPVSQIALLPPGADVLILTHNHQLDYELTVAALQHGQLRHIGLIGSDTKAQRFAKRFEKDGFSSKQRENVTCPVGLSEVPGKLPMEVAVSIAGELIAIEHQGKIKKLHRGLAWKEIKQSLQGAADAQNHTPQTTETTESR